MAAKPAVERQAHTRISLDSDLSIIAQARLVELRLIWRDRLGFEPPPVRAREVLRRMLAYRVQEAVCGGLSAVASRKLCKIEERRRAPVAKPQPTINLSAGMLLTREWKGVRHEVQVGGDGFGHEGQTYKSLSEVARAITGSRWNGPLFFGLRDKSRVAA